LARPGSAEQCMSGSTSRAAHGTKSNKLSLLCFALGYTCKIILLDWPLLTVGINDKILRSVWGYDVDEIKFKSNELHSKNENEIKVKMLKQ
jgi:hypothetical protein